LNRFALMLAGLCGLFGGTPLAAAPAFGAFSAGELTGWQDRVFNRATEYHLVEQDGRRVLQADCRDSASVLYRRARIDLRQTPVLRWSWRVEGHYAGLDERQKSGDDFLARVQVVVDGGLWIWRTRALNYVWAGTQAAGSAWPNAYTAQAMMLALRSGADGRWREEARDLRRDFREQFGMDVDHVDGVALMTDCDDSHGQGRAWYGDIRFTRE
jgi:hypothetical protein